MNNSETSLDVAMNSSANYIFYDLKSGHDYDLNVKIEDNNCFEKNEIFQDDQTFSFETIDEKVRGFQTKVTELNWCKRNFGDVYFENFTEFSKRFVR